MSRSPLALLLVLAGAALIIGAPLLFSVAPSALVWTDADQAQYQKAAADFHSATYEAPQHKGSSAPRDGSSYDPVAAKKKYESAKTAFELQKARLDAARSGPFWISTGLRILGIVVLVAGVYGYFNWRGVPRASAARTSSFQSDLASARAEGANQQASRAAGSLRRHSGDE